MTVQRRRVQQAWLFSKDEAHEDLHEAANQRMSNAGTADKAGDGSLQEFIDLMTNVELEELLRLILPIIKLEKGKYLIGTKVHTIMFRNKKLITRVGGGFMELN